MQKLPSATGKKMRGEKRQCSKHKDSSERIGQARRRSKQIKYVGTTNAIIRRNVWSIYGLRHINVAAWRFVSVPGVPEHRKAKIQGRHAYLD